MSRCDLDLCLFDLEHLYYIECHMGALNLQVIEFDIKGVKVASIMEFGSKGGICIARIAQTMVSNSFYAALRWRVRVSHSNQCSRKRV